MQEYERPRRESSAAGSVPRLSFEGVSRRFAKTPAVDDLSFSVGDGEIVCLLGHSGSGKTTSLRLAAGVERPESGAIRIGGTQVAGAGVFVPPERRSVGLIFQDFALFPHLTVLRNVAFGLKNLSAGERRERALAALERVQLVPLAGAYPHELSGGEQQRVALARALCPQPQLMLMDEPFSGLDPQLRGAVRQTTVQVLRELGTATLMVTHDPEEAMRVADRIILLRAGRIVQAADPETIWRAPADADVAQFFSPASELRAAALGGRVETPFGAAVRPGLPDGPVAVLVRPADIRLAGAGEGGATAIVRSAVFLGPAYELVLTLAGTQSDIAARLELPAAPAPGAQLEILCSPNRLLIFPV